MASLMGLFVVGGSIEGELSDVDGSGGVPGSITSLEFSGAEMSGSIGGVISVINEKRSIEE